MCDGTIVGDAPMFQHPLELHLLVERQDGVDLDSEPGQVRLDRRSGGPGLWEVLGMDAVEGREVVHVLTIIVGTLAGYGFSRFDFPFKNALFLAILATLMIAFQSLLIPLFIVLRNFGLTNSLVGLALVYIMFQLPFAIFVMRNSLDRIPRELEEAAKSPTAPEI
jgi:multiple sugar transport system permease protein